MGGQSRRRNYGEFIPNRRPETTPVAEELRGVGTYLTPEPVAQPGLTPAPQQPMAPAPAPMAPPAPALPRWQPAPATMDFYGGNPFAEAAQRAGFSDFQGPQVAGAGVGNPAAGGFNNSGTGPGPGALAGAVGQSMGGGPTLSGQTAKANALRGGTSNG